MGVSSFTASKESWYPLYRRRRGPRGVPGQARKISPPPGFDPRTVQPIANPYTDRPNPDHFHIVKPMTIVNTMHSFSPRSRWQNVTTVFCVLTKHSNKSTGYSFRGRVLSVGLFLLWTPSNFRSFFPRLNGRRKAEHETLRSVRRSPLVTDLASPNKEANPL
jgi:hypothetical protein